MTHPISQFEKDLWTASVSLPGQPSGEARNETVDHTLRQYYGRHLALMALATYYPRPKDSSIRKLVKSTLDPQYKLNGESSVRSGYLAWASLAMINQQDFDQPVTLPGARGYREAGSTGFKEYRSLPRYDIVEGRLVRAAMVGENLRLLLDTEPAGNSNNQFVVANALAPHKNAGKSLHIDVLDIK